MGGTFDHLHDGHKFLIKTALLFSKKIVIGLATENLLKKKKHTEKIENYKTREQNLKAFIDSIGYLNYKNALKINEIRESKSFTPLIIIVIPMIKDRNKNILSSTTIREKL
jgi:pantetheine-phosphate adenylyltransferase